MTALLWWLENCCMEELQAAMGLEGGAPFEGVCFRLGQSFFGGYVVV